MKLKLEEKKLDLDGRIYTLHVNMSVLEKVQEAHGGDFHELMNLSPSVLEAEVLAAMLNDWAEDQGWDDQWTARMIQKRFSMAMIHDLDVWGMFIRSVTPANKGSAEKPGATEDKSESGN